MKIIKQLKKDYLQLNGIVYRPYKVCDLPDKFGTEITTWFNYKGYTYIYDESGSYNKR
jgi:hypothetical protein